MTEADGAGDKLFHDESSSSLKDQVEVKFVSPQNGDAKINIGDLKSSFAGMGKDELMKFANDPFWVKLRWFLFVCFWLIWCGMLVGAIAIIVYAPKCAGPAPKEYYEKSPLHVVDDTTLKGLASKIDYLKSLGVQQIAVPSLLKTDPEDKTGSEVVVDFKDIKPSSGTLEEFKELISKLKAADIHLILSFSPDYSSNHHEFFKKSVLREGDYADYYVWAPARGTDDEGNPILPNNWLSKTGGPAWEWSPERKEFYLHQFNKEQPDFNFNNPKVVDYFNEVYTFWLDLGVSGFKLEHVQHLLEDPARKNETIGETPGFVQTDYSFYSHLHTAQAPGIANILNKWGSTIHNRTGGVLIVGDLLTENSTGVNLVSHKLEITPVALSANQLKSIVDMWSKQDKITWQWGCKEDRTLKCVTSPQLLDILNVLAFTLPGTPITTQEQLGSEAQSETESKDLYSHFSIYKQLVTQRQSPSIQYGSLHSTVYNDTVFAFTRIKSGNPGIAVAVNLDQKQAVQIDLPSKLISVPAEVTVLLTTQRISDTIKTNSTIPSNAVTLPPYSAVVFSFAPKSG